MRYKQGTSGKTKGFTLIELLVVIAIIALLMSILMPALTKVKRQAQGVLCQNGLKQWALILSMYAEDFDGYVPQGLTYESGAYTMRTWWYVAMRRYYTPNKNIFLCPTATKPREGGEIGEKAVFATSYAEQGNAPFYLDTFMPKEYLTFEGSSHGYIRVSYGINGMVMNWPLSYSNIDIWDAIGHQYNNVKISGANLVPVFGDCYNSSGSWFYWGRPTRLEGLDVVAEWDSEIPKWCRNRHGSKSEGVTNLSFLDGTVRRVGLKEMYTLHWHKKWKTEISQSPTAAEWPEWMVKFKDYYK